MTTPNAELAYRVLDQIDAHPEQWQQLSWISRPAGDDCGTAGCFAGWTCMLSGDKPCWEFADSEETVTVIVEGQGNSLDGMLVGMRAVELLGITTDQKHDLFHELNTREDLGRLVAEIFGPRPGGAS